MSKANWSVADAKARLSEVIARAAESGPQTITRNGRPAAVLVSAEEWRRRTGRAENLAEFFARSPLRGLDFDFDRKKDKPRKVEL